MPRPNPRAALVHIDDGVRSHTVTYTGVPWLEACSGSSIRVIVPKLPASYRRDEMVVVVVPHDRKAHAGMSILRAVHAQTCSLLQMALQGSSFRLFSPASSASQGSTLLFDTSPSSAIFRRAINRKEHTVCVTLLRRLEEVQKRRKNELKSQTTFCAYRRALVLKRSTSQR